MPRRSDTAFDSALKAFRRRKILTLVEVAGLIRRTIHTARRWLKAQMVHRRYNKNGRYYTLPDVPTFDSNGLWHWRGVLFSRYGNLTKTVIELVRRSEAGLDAAEVGERIGLTPGSDAKKCRDASCTMLPIHPFTPSSGNAVP